MESAVTLMAPVDRASDAEVRRQYALVVGTEWLARSLGALPHVVAMINQYRQIVYGNGSLAALLGVESLDDVIGRRFGEAVGCRHSDETTGGCGTTDYCTTCGAGTALLESWQGTAGCQECRIVSKSLGEDLDLRIWATPFVIGGETFTLFTLLDIRDEKRRAALECVFFHDVLNTASGVQGITGLLAGTSPDERVEMVRTLEHLSWQLIDEIESQRDLVAVERGNLSVHTEAFLSRDLLDDVADGYRRHRLAATRILIVAPGSENVRVVSDRRLLKRVICNMTKNALEACPAGATVTLTCDSDAERIDIRVHNPTVMPHNVQLQLFQRSFSTKGLGRGLGTYSMRLLSERYLGGCISFASTEQAGTTFTASYPRQLRAIPVAQRAWPLMVGA
jgi:histidine kinase/DNA gyrase B/HSP90-like ATPase